MNRESKLRRVAPGADEERIGALAELPVETVDAIAALVRQGRRDERAHQATLKRQRKKDARNHHHYDEAQLARRDLALVRSAGRRAQGGALEALATLVAINRHSGRWIEWGVEGCRAEGFSDREIAEVLGVTKQAVGQRYPRKGAFTPDLRPVDTTGSGEGDLPQTGSGP